MFWIELLIMPESRLLLFIEEIKDVVVVDPMFIVLFIILPLPDDVLWLVFKGMYLLEPPC